MNAADWSKVYIVVLNWNGWQDTIECLESLLKMTYPSYQIIVVDNGSTDGSVEKIKAWAEGRVKLVLLETGKNLGYAGGNNVGLRYALAQEDFEYVWVLNNDTVVHPEALIHMVRRMKEKPGAGICGSAVLQFDEPDKIWALGGTYDKWFAQGFHLEGGKAYDPEKTEKYQEMERKMDYVVGASALVSQQFLRDVGLMCEEYFLFFEELDWAMRARGRYSLALAPKSIVYHRGGASIKKKEAETAVKSKRFSPVADYYQTKNRLAFTLKIFPYALPTLYLSILGYIIDRVWTGEWENIRVISEATAEHFYRDILKPVWEWIKRSMGEIKFSQ